MIRLTKSQVLLIHDQLIAETGGSSGLRDEGILDSALSAPFQTFGGEDVYPSLQQKAARLCFGLVKNHPFVDGNKRIGAHVMLVFLALKGLSSFLCKFFRKNFMGRGTSPFVELAALKLHLIKAST